VPPLLAPMGGFGDFSRALLQGLADNSHISDLCLDLSSCEVRGQHPRVPLVRLGGPTAAVEGAPSLGGKVRALSRVGLGDFPDGRVSFAGLGASPCTDVLLFLPS